ncbi:hypothetical protein F4819DRAFT_484824 [Hypoxylon fuscum]|nr:hypothetical protein F4819DRAFT_484824 [Hypoxylon fuscum]
MQAFTVVNASIAIATVALAGTIQARDVTIDLWNDWNFEGTHWDYTCASDHGDSQAGGSQNTLLLTRAHIVPSCPLAYI